MEAGHHLLDDRRVLAGEAALDASYCESPERVERGAAQPSATAQRHEQRRRPAVQRDLPAPAELVQRRRVQAPRVCCVRSEHGLNERADAQAGQVRRVCDDPSDSDESRSTDSGDADRELLGRHVRRRLREVGT